MSAATLKAGGPCLGRRVNSAPGELTGTTSGNNANSTFKYRKVVGGKTPIPRSMSMTIQAEVSPQTFLDRMIKSRGYCTRNFCSLEGGYYCKPTELQKASYGIRIVQAVRASNVELLKSLLNCGLSPNPCNKFGESVVHMVCRRGDYKLLKVLVDNGCSLQVTDDFGRTPLHDACWTAKPNFEIVQLILDTDERLLHLVDCRGSSPLSYVKREHWSKWIAFFKSKQEIYWKPRKVEDVGEEPPPPLVSEAPHSRPIKDPKNAISVETAEKISSGKMNLNEFAAHRGDESLKNTGVTADSSLEERPNVVVSSALKPNIALTAPTVITSGESAVTKGIVGQASAPVAAST